MYRVTDKMGRILSESYQLSDALRLATEESQRITDQALLPLVVAHHMPSALGGYQPWGRVSAVIGQDGECLPTRDHSGLLQTDTLRN